MVNLDLEVARKISDFYIGGEEKDLFNLRETERLFLLCEIENYRKFNTSTNHSQVSELFYELHIINNNYLIPLKTGLFKKVKYHEEFLKKDVDLKISDYIEYHNFIYVEKN